MDQIEISSDWLYIHQLQTNQSSKRTIANATSLHHSNRNSRPLLPQLRKIPPPRRRLQRRLRTRPPRHRIPQILLRKIHGLGQREPLPHRWRLMGALHGSRARPRWAVAVSDDAAETGAVEGVCADADDCGVDCHRGV